MSILLRQPGCKCCQQACVLYFEFLLNIVRAQRNCGLLQLHTHWSTSNFVSFHTYFKFSVQNIQGMTGSSLNPISAPKLLLFTLASDKDHFQCAHLPDYAHNSTNKHSYFPNNQNCLLWLWKWEDKWKVSLLLVDLSCWFQMELFPPVTGVRPPEGHLLQAQTLSREGSFVEEPSPFVNSPSEV